MSTADLVQCCRVALWIRDFVAQLDVRCFPKTSGSKGMQLYVPINSASTYEDTKRVSKGLAQRLEREHPDLVVHRQLKALRTGKVLIDWSQNDDSKTTVNAYSLRARPYRTVSTPVQWEEVESTVAHAEADKLVFTTDDVRARVDRLGDLFAPVLTLRQTLPEP
ncbi:MAG: non-homologous end-joining DNA ligase LigD [Chloroflexota bacterium]